MSKTTTTLGQRLRAARERKEMTQQDLADAIGITREALQRTEDGTTKNPRSLEKIANELNSEFNSLLPVD